MERVKVHVYVSFQVKMWKKETKKVLEGASMIWGFKAL